MAVVERAGGWREKRKDEGIKRKKDSMGQMNRMRNR